MKEETKSKLKKYGKRAGFGLALVSLFLLGVGVGACSARKAVGSSAEDYTLSLAQPREVAPPLNPFDFPTLDPSEDNLLLGAYGGFYSWNTTESADGTIFAFTPSSVFCAYLARSLPAGLYRLELNTISTDWVGGSILCNSFASNNIAGALIGGGSSVFDYNGNFTSPRAISDGSGHTYQYFEISEPYNNLLVRVYSESTYGVKLSLVDGAHMPATYDITFPADYNPLAGFGTPSDGLIGQLAGNTSSPFRLDLYFRSGGQIFKRIDYYFLPMQGMEYVSALNSSGSPSVFTGSGFVYASMINYIAIDGTTFLAWRAIFGAKADGTLYLRNFGEWASKQYQTINVIDYIPVFGQSGVAPNLDQIGILELRTASGVPTPIIGGDSNADVFSLLSTGFTSVAGLLNIQILPFLTLGTLIFVPLVVMVIFAILKVLNK